MGADGPNDEDRKLNSEQTGILIGTLGCWAVGLAIGSILIAVGQPYQWDAINIYNDNREARGSRSLPPLPPPPAGIPPLGRVPGAEGPRSRGQTGSGLEGGRGLSSPSPSPSSLGPSAP